MAEFEANARGEDQRRLEVHRLRLRAPLRHPPRPSRVRPGTHGSRCGVRPVQVEDGEGDVRRRADGRARVPEAHDGQPHGERAHD